MATVEEKVWGRDCYGVDITPIIDRRAHRAVEQKAANRRRYLRRHGKLQPKATLEDWLK